MEQQVTPILDWFSALLQRIQDFLPELITALVVLAVGYAVARILRALTVRSAGVLGHGFRRFAASIGLRLAAPRQNAARATGEIVFWIVILLSIAAAARVLGVQAIATLLDRLVVYLPQIVAGLFIIFAGVILSRVARDATLAALRALPRRQRELVSRAVQVATVVILAIVGTEQIGIDVTIIVTVVAIVLAGVFGGLALAFALGARSYVGNLLGIRQLSREYHTGARIRVGDIEGTILEITSVAVVIETADGRLTVPGATFAERATLLVTQGRALAREGQTGEGQPHAG